VALGETAPAVDCLVAALEADPGSQPAHFQLGILFAEAGIYAEAVREFEAVVASDPKSEAAQQARMNLSRLRRMIDEQPRFE
jgi:tetratricopeptide (TPR) repeat protein